MKVDLFWIIVLALLLAWTVWRLSALAGRIDRVHHRIDLARASLDAQLLRRAAAAEAVAISGLIDPSSGIVLAHAASNSRYVDPTDLVERGAIESEMSRDLREVFADAHEVAELRRNPEGNDLVEDLSAACLQVELARRFLNDGVQAARLLRGGPLVRWFRLAGHAPQPLTFEMDDEIAPALAGLL
ncbi:MAG: hypothetical protein WCF36_00610 [Candidatus Nanopelagicales bacterium]